MSCARGFISGKHAALATLALLLSLTATACGAGGGSSGSESADSSAVSTASSSLGGAELGTISFEPEEASATSAIATPDAGATLRATGSDGTSYQLEVPAQAVTVDTELTIVPLTKVATGLGDEPTVAARFEPDGQVFARLVTLTIRPAEDIPEADRLLFVADHEGNGAGPAFVDPGEDDATLYLQHFSMAGETGVNDSAFDAAFGVARGDLADAYTREIAKLLQESKRNGKDSASVMQELTEAFDNYDKEVIQPAMLAVQSGPNRCSAVREISERAIGIQRQRVLLLGNEDDTGFVQAVELAYKDCEREAIRACKKARSPAGLLDFWIGMERSRALLGFETSVDLEALKEQAKAICVPNRYHATGGGAGVSTSGEVPDLTRPFGLDGVGSGFTVRFTYTPDEDGRSGTLSYVGEGSGMSMSGSGTYTVTGTDPEPLTLTHTTDGCVEGMGPRACRTQTEVITLTPVD